MGDSDFEEEEPYIVPRHIRMRKEGEPPPKRIRREPYKRKMWWFIMTNRPTHIPVEGFVNFRSLQETIRRYMHMWGFWRTVFGNLDDGWSYLGGFDKSKEADERSEIRYEEYGWIIPNEMTVEQLNFIFRLVNECGYDARIEYRSAEDYSGTPFLQKLEHFYYE